MERKIHLIGNAHIDPVWMWQWQEGFAEIKATFRSALDRMKEFDDFKFTSACSSYYMWIEKSDKAMFDEIVERVKEGRWNIVGGWFLQPDCNIPSGESFARHALISQRYFKEKFGITVRTGYNVDSFGHNWNIPQILKNSGMENYVFMRPQGHEKELPSRLFEWMSMDGSSVRTYRVPFVYNVDITRYHFMKQIEQLPDKHELMMFYGVGNHGGGPTIELLDKLHRDITDKYVFSTVDEYFDAVKEEKLPVVQDDLQFHAKGCYSACAQIKEGNRKAENELVNAEKYGVLSEHLMDTPYPKEELDKAWKNTLFNQFHDILDGCSIKEAYDDAALVHGEAIGIATRNQNYALQQISWNIDTMDGKELKLYTRNDLLPREYTAEERIGTPIVIFNPLAYPVKNTVHVRRMPKFMKDNYGNEIPTQVVRDSRSNNRDKYATLFMAEVPAYGYRVYRMYFEQEAKETFENPLIYTDTSIENECLRIAFNPVTGEVASIFDKVKGNELLSEDTRTVFMDETPYDTWAHDIREFQNVVGVFKEGEVKIIEKGPVRVTMRSKMKLFDTEIIRDYSLLAGSNKVLVKAKIDFHEKHKMLKFTFPVAVGNYKAVGKIPFGFIERSIDGAEHVCGEWNALHDGEKGITVANSSKYSFDAKENNLSLTILRGAIYNDHFAKEERDEFCEYMEQGIHRFEYTISPFESISESQKAAEQLNNPLSMVYETFHKGNLPTEFSGIAVSKENIVITAIKKHVEEEAIVLRAYETENKETDVEITILGTTFETHFAHNQVKTFKIADGIVRECDFMEWEK